MTWRDTLRTAGEAVRAHRLRSALTMLGIVIGITAVILTVGLGQGAKAEVQAQIDELGTNLLVITPGSSTDSSGWRGGLGSSSTLTIADAEALSSTEIVPDGQAVAPTSTSSASLTAGSTNWTTTLIGTTPAWPEVRSRGVSSGRFFTDEDEAGARTVVVLGPDAAAELFGRAELAVGQTVSSAGTPLTVVGVLDALSSSETASNNDLALVPWSTYSQRLIGGTDRESVSAVYLKATSAETLSAAYQEADRVLLQRHEITSSSSADFQIASQASILSAAASVDDTLTLMLGGIAVISLLVGGVGVMNIMLVSVSERTREIGLRKALGARPAAIRRQFLVEASVLGLAGGLVGVGLGLLGAIAVPRLLDASFVVSTPAVVAAIAVAVGIAVVFGVYPATRAARLAPIDALRSE
jgi:putative ABC transport system permease protein